MHLPICQIGVMTSVATLCPHPRNWEETVRTGKPSDKSMLSSPGLRKPQLRRTLGQVLPSRDVWILFCGKEIWDGVSKTSHFNPMWHEQDNLSFWGNDFYVAPRIVRLSWFPVFLQYWVGMVSHPNFIHSTCPHIWPLWVLFLFCSGSSHRCLPSHSLLLYSRKSLAGHLSYFHPQLWQWKGHSTSRRLSKLWPLCLNTPSVCKGPWPNATFSMWVFSSLF